MKKDLNFTYFSIDILFIRNNSQEIKRFTCHKCTNVFKDILMHFCYGMYKDKEVNNALV